MRQAYGAATFAERTELAANAIYNESYRLFRNETLALVFHGAALEAGNAFAGAFDREGRPLTDSQASQVMMKRATSAAGAIAARYSHMAFEAAGISADPEKMLMSAGFGDMVAIAAAMLGREAPAQIDMEAAKASLHNTVPKDDYFYGEIENLPASDMAPDADNGRREGLEVIVRLANATWRAGQPQRAVWEGNDDRIDPDKRDSAALLDLNLQKKFDRLVNEQKVPEESALIHCAFELYKDILEVKKYIGDVYYKDTTYALRDYRIDADRQSNQDGRPVGSTVHRTISLGKLFFTLGHSLRTK